jgi:uncharacterized membrane protein
MKRLTFLDALRGVAILLMIVDHAYDWWLSETGQATVLARRAEFLGTLAAPLFLVLVGIGLSLSGRRAADSGHTTRAVAVHLARRGAALVLLGYAVNLLVFFEGDNPADLWAVDVLHTIGVSLWLSIPLLRARGPVVVGAMLGVAVLGQMAGQWTLPRWLAAYLTGAGGTGYFPLLLWLPFVYLGLITGRQLSRRGRNGRLMAALSGAGLGLMALTPVIRPDWGYRHPRPMFVLFAAAIVFWLMALMWVWTVKWQRFGLAIRALSTMGRTSLMIYVLHHLVGYRLFWLFGWVSGRSWRGDYGVFSPAAATALLLALIGLMIAGGHLWLGWRQRRADR